MALGSLVVEVAANVARFQSDMGKIAQIAEDRARQVDKALGIVSTSLKSLGAGFVVGLTLEKIQGKIEAVIESAAGLQNLAERTGATVEGLSGLAAVAKLTGTDTDQLAIGLQKLSKALVDAKDGGTKTTAAFEAIGIKTKDLVGLKPDEAFLLISNRLAAYADGAEKTAIAQTLLGKTGANLLPVMKDLADLGELQVKITAEQAEQADEFEKNLVRLNGAQNAIFKTIGLELVPVLDTFTKALLDSAIATDGVRGTATALAKDGSIREWAEDGVKFVGFVIDAFQGVIRVVQITGTYLGATAAALDIVWNSSLKQVGPRLAGLRKEVEADLDAIAQKTLFSDTLAKRLEQSHAKTESKPAREQIKFNPNTGGGADDPAKKMLEGVLKAQDAFIAAEKTLLATREQTIDFFRNLDYLTLREAEERKQALIADTLAQTLAAYDKESAAIVIQIAQAKKATDAQDARNKLGEVAAKRAAAEVEANKKIGDSRNALVAVQRQFDLATAEGDRQAAKANDTALFEIALLGQSTLTVLKLAAARRIDLDLEERIYQLRKKDPTANVSEAIAAAEKQKKAALDAVEQSYLKQREGAFGAQEALRKYAEMASNHGAQIENAMTNAFKGAEDALVNFVKTGKLDFKSLADSIITDLIRIQVQRMLGFAAQTTSSGGWGSLFSGLLGLGGSTSGLSDSAVSSGAALSANGFAGYANGLPYVPYDGFTAVLHEGERVMTKQENASSESGQTVHFDYSGQTINVGQGVSRGEVQAAVRQGNAQNEARIKRLLRNGNV